MQTYSPSVGTEALAWAGLSAPDKATSTDNKQEMPVVLKFDLFLIKKAYLDFIKCRKNNVLRNLIQYICDRFD